MSLSSSKREKYFPETTAYGNDEYTPMERSGVTRLTDTEIKKVQGFKLWMFIISIIKAVIITAVVNLFQSFWKTTPESGFIFICGLVFSLHIIVIVIVSGLSTTTVRIQTTLILIIQLVALILDLIVLVFVILTLTGCAICVDTSTWILWGIIMGIIVTAAFDVILGIIAFVFGQNNPTIGIVKGY